MVLPYSWRSQIGGEAAIGHVQRQHLSLLRRQFVTATRAQKASSAARSTDLLLEEEPLQTRLPGTVDACSLAVKWRALTPQPFLVASIPSVLETTSLQQSHY